MSWGLNSCAAAPRCHGLMVTSSVRISIPQPGLEPMSPPFQRFSTSGPWGPLYIEFMQFLSRSRTHVPVALRPFFLPCSLGFRQLARSVPFFLHGCLVFRPWLRYRSSFKLPAYIGQEGTVQAWYSSISFSVLTHFLGYGFLEVEFLGVYTVHFIHRSRHISHQL